MYVHTFPWVVQPEQCDSDELFVEFDAAGYDLIVFGKLTWKTKSILLMAMLRSIQWKLLLLCFWLIDYN